MHLEDVVFARAALDDLQKQHVKLKEHVPELKLQVCNLKQRVSELEASKGAFESDLAAERIRGNKLAAANSKLVAWNAEFEAEKIRLKSGNEELRIKNHDLQEKFNNADNKVHVLTENRKLEETVIDVKERFSEAEGATTQHNQPANVQGKVASLEEEVTLHEEQNALLAIQIDAYKTKCDKSDRRVKSLENSLRVYRELVLQGSYDPVALQIENRLKDVGLHKDCPRKEFVSPTYFHNLSAKEHVGKLKRAVVTSRGKINPIDESDITWED